MSAQLQAQVRINLVGVCKGVKDGGVLQQSLHEVTVTAKPNDIPDSIDVDVTELQVGDTIYISDIQTNKQVTIGHDGEEVVASVLAPRQEEEISTGEQQDGGIPENEEGRKPRHHQSHDAGIKQVNRDIIGVALNELRLFNLWMHPFRSDRFFHNGIL